MIGLQEMVGFEKFDPFIVPSLQSTGDDRLSLNDMKKRARFFAKEAYIKMAKESDAFKCDLCIDLQKCVQDYPLDIEKGWQLKSVERADLKDCCLRPARPECRELMCDEWEFKDCRIHIGYVPECDEKAGLMVRVTVYPDSEVCEMPKAFYECNREAITNLALSTLHSQFGQPFYNGQLATYFNDKAQACIGEQQATGNGQHMHHRQRLEPECGFLD